MPFNSGFASSARLLGDKNKVITKYIKAANIVEGTYTYKYGDSTGLTNGRVLSTNYTSSSTDGVTLTNTLKLSNSCSKGDSGGPVVIASSYSGSKYEYSLIGITCRKATDNSFCVAVKAGYIIAKFNLTLCTESII